MNTFIEFLAKRDTDLLKEYVEYANKMITEAEQTGEAPAQLPWWRKWGQTAMKVAAPVTAGLMLAGGMGAKAQGAPQDPSQVKKQTTSQTVKDGDWTKTTTTTNTEGKFKPKNLKDFSAQNKFDKVAADVVQKVGGNGQGDLKSYGPGFENLKYTIKDVKGQKLNSVHPKIKGKVTDSIFRMMSKQAGAQPVFQQITPDGNFAIIFTGQ